jgi:hypothetical protein
MTMTADPLPAGRHVGPEVPKIEPGAIVPRAVRNDGDSYSRATHVERINPGANPADIPGAKMEVQPMPEDRGPKRSYKTLTSSFHGGVLVPAGSLVELHDDEVGKHHELVAPASEAEANASAETNGDRPRDASGRFLPKQLYPAKVAAA